jgi:hypothetical protein
MRFTKVPFTDELSWIVHRHDPQRVQHLTTACTFEISRPEGVSMRTCPRRPIVVDGFVARKNGSAHAFGTFGVRVRIPIILTNVRQLSLDPRIFGKFRGFPVRSQILE